MCSKIPKRGFLVNEVNHTMEFHTLAPVTGVDIAGVIVDYTIALAKGRIKLQPPNLMASPARPTRLIGILTFDRRTIRRVGV